jgi:hypothetical protein
LGEACFQLVVTWPSTEMSFGFAFGAAAEAGSLARSRAPFVFDGADGQPQQFDPSVVVGEVAPVLDSAGSPAPGGSTSRTTPAERDADQ